MVVAAIQGFSSIAENLSDPEGPFAGFIAENIEKTSRHAEQIVEDLKKGRGPMGTVLKSEDLLETDPVITSKQLGRGTR